MNLLLCISTIAVAAATVLAKSPPLTPVTRHGTTLYADGKPWKAVGPNIYWLGLDENVVPPAGQPFDPTINASYPNPGRITDALATVRALGGTMIRAHTLGISLGNPLSVMPSPGVINTLAFDAIDWAVYQTGLYGVRLLVPLVDNYDYYHGGKYDFLRWAGLNLTQADDSGDPQIMQFYTNQTIVAAFKDYIRMMLTHRNQYNGLAYADDPAIFAYETGNELFGPVWGDMDCPADWVRDIAQFIKSLAPQKLVLDGTYGVNATHFEVEEIDIFSNHYYPPNTTTLQLDLAAVQAANRTYFAGEFDWTGPDVEGGSDNLVAFFDIVEKSPVAIGDAFWSLFGRDLPNCNIFVNHTDGYTLHYNDPSNSAYVTSRIELIREHFLAISRGLHIAQNASLPVVACPAPALSR